VPSRPTTLATVLFTDVVASTEVAAELGDRRWQELIRRHHGLVRRELRRYGGREIDTAGDGFFATFDRPAAAIHAACGITDAVRELGIEVRAGVHVGEVEVRGPKVGGMAVNIGARVMALAGPGEVLVTATAKDLVPGSGFGFEDREAHRLKGVPGTWPVFAVTSVDGRGRPAPPSPLVARERREAIQPTSVVSRRRWIPAVAGIVVVVLILVGVAVLREDQETPPPSGGIPLGSAVEIDPETGDVLAIVSGFPPSHPTTGPLAVPSTRAAYGDGSLWIVTIPFLVNVDPEEREVDDVLQPEPAAIQVTVAFGTVWVGVFTLGLARLDPATDTFAPVALPDDPLVESTFGVPSDIDVGQGGVWASFSGGGLIRIGRDRNLTLLEPGGALNAMAVGEGAVWLADQLQGTLSRLEPGHETAEPVADVAGNLDQLAAGEGYVWVLDTGAGTVTPVDPQSGPKTPIRVGEDPTDLAVGLGAAWISDGSGAIFRIDAGTLSRQRFTVDGPVAALAVADDRQTLWAIISGR
jgi:class 3 adenylate cyclase/streptogramin lyase